MRFLKREIKQDKQGLYFYYGGYRLRPASPKRTRFNLDDEVSIIVESNRSGIRVMTDAEEYELWRSKTRLYF